MAHDLRNNEPDASECSLLGTDISIVDIKPVNLFSHLGTDYCFQ